MDPVALAACSSEELGAAVAQVHALENVARATLLELADRAKRERDEDEQARAKEGQFLLFRRDPNRPVTRVRGCMPNDIAEVIQRAVEREADGLPPNPETGLFDPYASRRVDALHKICSQRLGADGDADRATVVLHRQPDGSSTFSDGTTVPSSVAEWLSCDCREEHPDGSVSSVISTALRRQVLRRDGGCTFPGC